MFSLDRPKQSIKDSEGRTRYWTGYGYMNSSTGLAAIPKPGQKTSKPAGPETTGHYIFALPTKP
jgi:hypothetical protein